MKILKNKPYWLTGAVIGIIVYFIIYILFLVIINGLCSVGDDSLGGCTFGFGIIFGLITAYPLAFIFEDLPYVVYGIVNYAFIGALIGLIIGLIKSRKRK